MDECPSCALPVDRHEHAEHCPYCGYEFPAHKTGVTPIAWLMVLLLVIPLLWILSKWL
jgi:hypothetical protein